jgi:pyruvate/2-oxoglutarate dehydrogenase complex dihydrolipoamide dehydrogenase (E3) component
MLSKMSKIRREWINMSNFDVLIIGAGQAGVPLAHSLARVGQSVGLIERKHLGGSCVNFGCTPTKAAIASAKLAYQARRAHEYGVRIPQLEIDFRAVLERAQQIALRSRHGLEAPFEQAENPKLIRGHARLLGREFGNAEGLFRVSVNDEILLAKTVVLNTGTRSLIPSIPGLEDVRVFHAGNWLEMQALPEHVAIVGAGYIGLEMAQFYRRMGTQVTVFHHGTQVVDHEDLDVANEIQALLEREGIDFFLNTKLSQVETTPEGIRLRFEQANETRTLEVSHVFVSAGRKPNTDDLGLETVGVTQNDQGLVHVNGHLETNVKGIFVAGDIRGGQQFTQTSWDDFRILESQLIGDRSRTTERVVPYALFTDPELGRVGITEREAALKGLEVRTVCFEMKHNSKALETGESEGFIKLVVDANDHLLGAAVLANSGSELVHLYANLINSGRTLDSIRDAIYAHPTLAEAIQSAAALVRTD